MIYSLSSTWNIKEQVELILCQAGNTNDSPESVRFELAISIHESKTSDQTIISPT